MTCVQYIMFMHLNEEFYFLHIFFFIPLYLGCQSISSVLLYAEALPKKKKVIPCIQSVSLSRHEW